jgi:hypothetical protein
MRRDLMPTAPAAGPRRGLALVVSLALAGAPGLARAQEPGGPPPSMPSPYAQPERPVQVDLRLGPERLLGAARMRITPRLPGLGPVSERPVFGPTMSLMLRPGPYTIEVFARRYSASVDLSVAPGMSAIQLEMQKKTRDTPRFERDRKLATGLAGVTLVQVLAGAGVAIAGAARESSVLRRNEGLLMDALVDAASSTPKKTTGLALVESTYSTASYHRDLSRAMTLEVAGTTVMMAGLGAVMVAIPVAEQYRLRVAYVEMGLGAALAAGGATWLTFFERDRKALFAATDPTDRVTTKDLHSVGGAALGGAVLTGLGIGLVVFPAIALLNNAVKQRRNRNTSLRPFMGRGQAGLSFQGRF